MSDKCECCDRPLALGDEASPPEAKRCNGGRWCAGDPVDWRARALAAEEDVKHLRGELEEIAFTSTDMPAAWNDAESWYRSQLGSAVGRAAQAIAKGPK